MAWLRDKEAKKTLAVPILGWPSVFFIVRSILPVPCNVTVWKPPACRILRANCESPPGAARLRHDGCRDSYAPRRMP